MPSPTAARPSIAAQQEQAHRPGHWLLLSHAPSPPTSLHGSLHLQPSRTHPRQATRPGAQHVLTNRPSCFCMATMFLHLQHTCDFLPYASSVSLPRLVPVAPTPVTSSTSPGCHKPANQPVPQFVTLQSARQNANFCPLQASPARPSPLSFAVG